MTQDQHTKTSDPRRELIAFRIGQQEYCVDIMSVREIRGWTPATPLPHAQRYMRGVINLRGTVLPIIDLSERLGLGTTIAEARHVIIVVRSEHREVGLLVDAVCDILSVTDQDVQPTPSVANDTVKSFVRGILAVEGRMIGLVALERILPEEYEAEAA
jgi:purine-binding chemotaxis protein CheW